MKNLRKAFANMATKYKPKCDPTPGKWNSCEPCKDCGKRAKYPESDTTPCCIITPPLIFDTFKYNPPITESNEIQISVNCQTRLFFTTYQISGNGFGNVILVHNGSENFLNPGDPYGIDVLQNDIISFKLDAIVQDCCYEVYVYNSTCNILNTICVASICSNP